MKNPQWARPLSSQWKKGWAYGAVCLKTVYRNVICRKYRTQKYYVLLCQCFITNNKGAIFL